MGKKKTDAKQNARIKSLESMVYKTLENKQVNYQTTNANISTSWYETNRFISLGGGVADGDDYGSLARIGNSITLMSQRCSFNFKKRTGADDFNQIRIILVESVDGTQTLSASDVLLYADYSTHGDLCFASPYTTKTDTNKRYKVHMDRVMTLTDVKPTITLEKVIKYGKTGKVVDYASQAILHPNNHALNIMILSDSGAVQHPRMDFNIRSTFKDA